MADTVSQIGSAGDYADLRDWWAAIRDVSGTHTAEIANEIIGGREQRFDGGGTCDGIIIKPAAGAEHVGVPRDVSGQGATVRYDGNTFYFHTMNPGISVVVEDIIIERTVSVFAVLNETNPRVTFRRCVIFGGPGQGTYELFGNGGGINLYDSFVWCRAQEAIRNPGGGEIVGNTFVGESTLWGLDNSGNAEEVSNNVMVGFTSGCFYGSSPDPNTGGNISSDATANSFNNAGNSHINVEFLEAGETPTGDYVAIQSKQRASADLHLADLAHGTHPNVAFDGGLPGRGTGFDIDRQPRSPTAPDIGGDEFGAVVPPSPVVRRMIQDANLLLPGRLIT